MATNNPNDAYGFQDQSEVSNQVLTPDTFDPATETAPQPLDQPVIEDESQEVPVTFPKHLFIPANAEPVDIRKLVVVPAGTIDAELFSFTPQEGQNLIFTHYGILNLSLDASLTEFLATLEGHKLFPFHGDPTDSFRLSLGLSTDLGENSLVNIQLNLSPNQTIRWGLTNNSAVSVVMGVRMKGYIDLQADRASAGIGA